MRPAVFAVWFVGAIVALIGIPVVLVAGYFADTYFRYPPLLRSDGGPSAAVASRFPTGSSEAALRTELKAEGFRFLGCDEEFGCDAEIQIFDLLGTTTAVVTWKADARHNILWTRGQRDLNLP